MPIKQHNQFYGWLRMMLIMLQDKF